MLKRNCCRYIKSAHTSCYMERPEIGNATRSWRQPICPTRIRQTVNQWHRNFGASPNELPVDGQLATSSGNKQQATSCGKQRLIIIIKNKFIYTFQMLHSGGAQGRRKGAGPFIGLDMFWALGIYLLYAVQQAACDPAGNQGRRRWDCRWSAATAVSLREIWFVFMCCGSAGSLLNSGLQNMPQQGKTVQRLRKIINKL